jgi:hypothetical protein
MTPDPALLERIAAAMRSDLRPVRRMPPPSLLSAALFAIFAGTSWSGAALLGFAGFHRLSEEAIAAIFPPLAALALLAAGGAANAMIPGSKRPYHPAGLLAAASIVLAAVFAFLFRDYRTDAFVHQGIPCLRAGLLWAIPGAIGAWLLLRHGFAVERGAAGLAVGTFAGLAGVTMLELHCPNLRMPHIVVWHLAVLPIAALAGKAIWVSARRRET